MAGEDAGLHEFHPDSLIVSKDNTQQRLIGTNISIGNTIGKGLSVILSQWINVS